MEQSQASSNGDSIKDDFKKIKGIGESVEKVLYTLGILRYEDLANYTPEQLENLMKEYLPQISARRIERYDWIGQARKLAAEKEPAEPAIPSINLDHQARELAAPGGWREIADFFVSFGYSTDPSGQEKLMTRVHHSQADKSMQWNGVSTDQLIDWLLKEVGMPAARQGSVKSRSAHKTGDLSRALEEEASLEISDIWVSEVQVPVPAGSASQAEALRVDGNLHLSGSRSSDLAQQRQPYTVEVYLVDIKSNQSRLVASSNNRLAPGNLSYTFQKDFRVPPAGRYQLFIIARTLPPVTLVTHAQGPIINVEA